MSGDDTDWRCVRDHSAKAQRLPSSCRINEETEMIEEYGRAPSGRAAAADAVEPISVVSSKASIPNAKRREWAERIANQFESDDVDAIEEGIARGAELAGAPLLRNALTRIAYLRPAGDADTATGTRALVKQMELIALEALGGRQ